MNQGCKISIVVNPRQAEVNEASDRSLSVRLPIKIKRYSARTRIFLPDGSASDARPWDINPTPLQLALARGHRWLKMLETGECRSLREIAKKEDIDNSYISRMVNLTILAPDIVTAILDDNLPEHITLFKLAVNPPKLWDEQREMVWGNSIKM